MLIKVGQIWRHNKKGDLYKIIGLAKHSETLEDLVIYEPQYENPLAELWARPISAWQELVDIQGEKKPRFELIS